MYIITVTIDKATKNFEEKRAVKMNIKLKTIAQKIYQPSKKFVILIMRLPAKERSSTLSSNFYGFSNLLHVAQL